MLCFIGSRHDGGAVPAPSAHSVLQKSTEEDHDCESRRHRSSPDRPVYPFWRGSPWATVRLRFVPAGESAVLLTAHEGEPAAIAAHLRRLLTALDAAPPPHLVDAIPTSDSMLLLFDPLRTTAHELETAVNSLLLPAPTEQPRPRLIELPVLYGGEAGVDLDRVAALAGLEEHEVVKLHAGTEYSVRFLGFMPGFPYLGALPPPLHTPRHETPRTVVPAGSVAIAEDQTSIYPVASPGGWNLIGRTPCRLFDVREAPPSLLVPGDRVQFYPVEEAEYSRIHFEILADRR